MANKKKSAVNLTFKTYSQIIKVAFGEELERMQEYLHFIESEEDVVDDKPWTAEVEAPPSWDQVKAFLAKVEDYTYPRSLPWWMTRMPRRRTWRTL